MEDAGLLAVQVRQARGDDEGWAFKVGECVRLSENTIDAEGIVIDRIRLADGGNLYRLLNIFDDEGEFGYANERAISAVLHGGRCCVECPLLRSAACPRKLLQ